MITAGWYENWPHMNDLILNNSKLNIDQAIKLYEESIIFRFNQLAMIGERFRGCDNIRSRLSEACGPCDVA